MTFKRRLALVLTLAFLLSPLFLTPPLVSANLFTSLRDRLKSVFTPAPTPSPAAGSPVLGSGSYQSQPPSLYIHGDNNRYSSGGLITQATTDEPALTLSGYKVPPQLEIKLYKATKSDLLQYLVHDKEGNQLNRSLSVDAMEYEGTIAIETGSQGDSYASTRHNLPITGSGLWYLTLRGGSVELSAFLLRSGHGVMVTEGQNELVYWAQEYATMRSKSGGSLKLYSFLSSQTELGSATFDSSGIAKTQLTDQADLALSEFGDDFAVVPLNLTYLNNGYGYGEFRPQIYRSRYFSFTDRPLYGPGDTVHYKALIRDDVDATYSIPSGVAHVTLSAGGGDTEYKVERTLPISPDGTITTDFELQDAPVGYYSIMVQTSKDKALTDKNLYGDYTGVSDYAYTSFQVEHYRKPELFLEASVSESIVTAGTPLKFTLSGEYFAGQPLSGENLSYKVTASDYYEYAYLSDAEHYSVEPPSDDYRYGVWYGSHQVVESTVTLDKQGQATIEVPTDLSYSESGQPQIFMLEVKLASGEQDSAYARKNVLVKAGRFGLFGTEYVWSSQKDREVSLPLILRPNIPDERVANQSIQVDLTRTVWKKEILASEKYPRYTDETIEEGTTTLNTDSSGRATLTFTPSEVGSYTLKMSAQDSLGNTIKKTFNLYVSDQDLPTYNPSLQSEDLSLTSPKDTYAPSATVPLRLTSSLKDRDVFLSVERGATRRYEVISLDGGTKDFTLKLTDGDQPNLYLTASSFSTYRFDTTSLPLTVETRDKKLNVELTPDRQKYGPGDTVTLKLKTTTDLGQPVSAELALWSVDKALLELTDSRLGNIYETFWNKRANSTAHSHSLRGILAQVAEGGGGCFLPGTEVTLADGTTRPIEQIRVGDRLTTLNAQGRPTTARVTATHQDQATGYLTINNSLRATADHLLNINGTWQEAGRLNLDDTLRTVDGAVAVTSLFYQSDVTPVYNLTVADEHTFLADHIWVHNEKGLDRTVFKDVAYWNPSVRTGSDGLGEVSFTLPDNLTTWAITAVGSTKNTVVGQNQVELKTSKALVVKPLLPNLVRSGDTLTLSAIARNFTDQAGTFSLGIKVEGAELLDSDTSTIRLDPLESLQSYWRVKPQEGAKAIKVEMSMLSKADSSQGDRVTQEIPVKPFGFRETQAEVGTGSKTYSLNVPKDALNPDSKLTLSLASSVVTALQPAMQYLIHYPYGCVEQLTSATVPALIAAKFPELFPNVPAGSELDTYLKAGLQKISEAHNAYTGWGWWNHAPVTPFVTSYVLETLVAAQDAGYTKETKSAIVDATNYLSRTQNDQGQPLTDADLSAARYGLSFVGKADKLPRPSSLDGLEDDLLALAVIGNYRAGDHNPESNGLNLLVSRAQLTGNSAHWQSGDYSRFGSIDASTAWAIRAILVARGDRDLAVAGANYLLASRKSNYWSNTYGTVLTLRALTELYEDGDESSPNYSYTVLLDGAVVQEGTVTSATTALADLSLPVTKTSHQIEIRQVGEGQLYSSLVSSLFRTDPHAEASANGLTLTRSYTNANDPNRTIALGDLVEVALTVSGSGDIERQGVIEDQLPAGLVPINESFKNEQGNQSNSYDNYVTKQFTDNGAVLAAHNLGSRTYTYRARVVSMGTFQIPPATVSLMYSPEIYGRTAASTLTISSESKLLPGKALEAVLSKLSSRQFLVALGFILTALLTSFFLYRRYRKSHPPTPPGVAIPPAPPTPVTPTPREPPARGS